MSKSLYWKVEVCVSKTGSMHEKCYQNVNYYHLEGYWYPFYDKSKQDHFFYDDVHLSQIVRHFEFDNSLRNCHEII